MSLSQGLGTCQLWGAQAVGGVEAPLPALSTAVVKKQLGCSATASLTQGWMAELSQGTPTHSTSLSATPSPREEHRRGLHGVVLELGGSPGPWSTSGAPVMSPWGASPRSPCPEHQTALGAGTPVTFLMPLTSPLQGCGHILFSCKVVY